MTQATVVSSSAKSYTHQWVAFGLMVLVLARSQGARWKGGILLALLAPPLVHLVFYKLLRVPLPPGLLNLPWA